MNIQNQKSVIDRNSGIGGSDATYLAAGKWKELYEIKKGISEQEDLSFILPVQLGIYTESFNREWFTAHTDFPVQEIDHTLVHKDYPFMLANVDGFVLNQDLKTMGIFEAKHTNMMTKDDTILEKYYAQVQHYMMVTNKTKAWLSVIFGNVRWKAFIVSQDKKFQRKLLNAEHQFWTLHVEKDVAPDDYVDFQSIEEVI
jgi:predicted phage-related endonuclease|tara:strand:+ start:184 stop:780 length:597 start_codon:yes stop_codon:yes gene_type:complete